MDLTRIARGGTPIQLDKLRILFFDKQATWLIIQRYGVRFMPVLCKPGEAKKGQAPPLELASIDALSFILWAGLQPEAREKGEELTLEQVDGFFTPYSTDVIFRTVIVALGRSITAPAPAAEDRLGAQPPGKDGAAAARPVAVARPKGPGRLSTLQTRSGSRSRSSGKRPSSSGRPR